jgi:hypothetical protein
MANIPIYPGSSSFIPGNTPFGFYDYDYDFQIDADKIVTFCARRLGYPLVDVELQDLNFYTAFEEAITTYGNEVYAYKVRQDYLDIEGFTTSSALNHSLIRPNQGGIIRISEQYGIEANVGGDVNFYSGSIVLREHVQDYDLNEWAASQSLSGQDVTITRLFRNQIPASVRYLDPYIGAGNEYLNILNDFGWANYGIANTATLYPIYFDIQKIQEIEMNDLVRRSQISFELRNNKLRLFPKPGEEENGVNLWFEYYLKSEKNTPIAPSGSGLVTNVSNVPFANPIYGQINSIGRQWIFEYTLALCKEMLGYIRGKYSTIPIPNSEVTLNQSDLINAATAEKTALVEKLKLYLEETSREKILERKSLETDARLKELQQTPYLIYIG